MRTAKEAQPQIRALLKAYLKFVSRYGRIVWFILNKFPELMQFG
jgi:hypothetical protein